MRGPGRKFLRGSIWWIAYYALRNGRTVEVRGSVGTEQEANRRLRERIHEVKNHKQGIKAFVGPKQERVTVEALLQGLERDYAIHHRSTWKKVNFYLTHIRTYFGHDRARAVTRSRLLAYIEYRQKHGGQEQHDQPGTRTLAAGLFPRDGERGAGVCAEVSVSPRR